MIYYFKKVNGLDDKVNSMSSNLDEVKQRVIKTDLTIENEIRVNIQHIAEKHLDLSSNLHEAMKPNNEVEMLAVKVRILETDVKAFKEKIS